MNGLATFGSGDVVLAPLLVEHVTDRYVRWLNDPRVTRWTLIPPNQSKADVEAYVRANLNSTSSAMWRILVGDEHVGNIRLSGISKKDERAEIALMIGEPSYWGRGLGSMAIRAVTEHAFREMGIHRIQAGIYRDHEGSRKAFVAAGYHLECIRKDFGIVEGRRVDALLMVRFATDPGTAEQAS